jgi:hypothetical protein
MIKRNTMHFSISTNHVLVSTNQIHLISPSFFKIEKSVQCNILGNSSFEMGVVFEKSAVISESPTLSPVDV